MSRGKYPQDAAYAASSAILTTLVAVAACHLGPLGVAIGEGVLGNLVFQRADASTRRLHQGLFGKRGVLNHDLADALHLAFVNAVTQLEKEWAQHGHYKYLETAKPEEARRTQAILHGLREDAERLFKEGSLSGSPGTGDLLTFLLEDESGKSADRQLAILLHTYFYGHDEILINFMKEKLPVLWIAHFEEILKSPGDAGTRAWRALILLDRKRDLKATDELLSAAAETQQTVKRMRVHLERPGAYLPDYVQVVDPARYAPASPARINQYYEGGPFDWDIIAADGVVQRDLHGELVDLCTAPPFGTRMICLTGELAAGKTTLAWSVAADVVQKTGWQLLRVVDNEKAEVWYGLPTYVQHYGQPVVVLVDDVFRASDAQTALAALGDDLPITIIATSLSNEMLDSPDDLSFPCYVRVLGAPTEDEETAVRSKLGQATDTHPHTQARLAVSTNTEGAKSWLAMMVQLSTGEKLTKRIRDTMARLRRQDRASGLYQAYAFLCFAWQYGIWTPESLLEQLDSEGAFFRLAKVPAARGLIFRHQTKDDLLRVQHSLVAIESLKEYRRPPRMLAAKLIDGVTVSNRSHRIFLAELLNALARDKHFTDIDALLYEKEGMINAALAACDIVELADQWLGLFAALRRWDRRRELVSRVLSIDSDTVEDEWAKFKVAKATGDAELALQLITGMWKRNADLQRNTIIQVCLTFIRDRGDRAQIATALEETRAWLAVHSDNGHVRGVYLGLVRDRGDGVQVTTALKEIHTWLVAHPDDRHTRGVYLGLVRERGTPEQVAAALEETRAWLDAHPDDARHGEIRETFLRLVTQRVPAAITETKAWLDAHPNDRRVGAVYLGLVRERGTPEQVAAALEETRAWLDAHPDDRYTQGVYLRTLRECGTAGQVTATLQEMAGWLAAHSENGGMRGAYLRIVRERGTPEQVAAALEETRAWLDAHPDDTPVRSGYFALVLQRGGPTQVSAALKMALSLLASHPETPLPLSGTGLLDRHGSNEQVVTSPGDMRPGLAARPRDKLVCRACLRLLRRSSSKEQIKVTLEDMTPWLVAHPDDKSLRRAYFALIEQPGNQELIPGAIELAMAWLAANGNDTAICHDCVRFIARNRRGWYRVPVGTPESHELSRALSAPLSLHLRDLRTAGTIPERRAAVDEAASWLANTFDAHVFKSYCLLTSHNGTKQQIAIALELGISRLSEITDSPDPGLVSAYAWLCFKGERYALAERLFLHALELWPELREARAGLARCLYGRNEWAAARVELEYLFDSSKRGGPFAIGHALHEVGCFCLARGAFTTALKFFERANQQFPEGPRHYTYYSEPGRAFMGAGLYRDAEDAFRKALGRLPEGIDDEIRVELEQLVAAAVRNQNVKQGDA